MNLFFLDRDLDRCAEYHIDKHVTKMVLEAAQLLTTTVWIDKLFGYVPEKLSSEQLKELNHAKSKEPSIEERTFTRYLPTHVSHPSAVWVRSSIEHYYWTVNYANALTEEAVYRGFKRHASCTEVNRLPDLKHLPDVGWTDPTLAMPEHLKGPDHIQAYRMFYMLDKWPFASWKVRGKPHWWDDELVEAQKEKGGRVSGR